MSASQATGLAGAEALEPSGLHPSDGIPRASFTPGPWKLEEWQDGALYVGYGRIDRGGIDGVICGWPDVADYTFATQDRMKANARLIAAAPELYEALAEMARQHGGNCEKARKALAKARGES